MENMREIKLRIKSVSETRQITKAMKLISAAKRKKARQQLDKTLPYFSGIKATVADILSRGGDITGRYFDKRADKQEKSAGIFTLTGDKSLTGGYNHNIIRHTEQLCRNESSPVLFVAGQTGRSYFLKKPVKVDESFDFQVSDPTVERAGEIAEIMLERFLSGEIDAVYLNYTRMINTLSLVPETMKLLPLSAGDFKEDQKAAASDKADGGSEIYFEPSPGAVLDRVVPQYLKGMVYGALVESFTSEQSARMTAMDSATVNADQMISSLNLRYNRARQAAITQEITEIVGGASALE